MRRKKYTYTAMRRKKYTYTAMRRKKYTYTAMSFIIENKFNLRKNMSNKWIWKKIHLKLGLKIHVDVSPVLMESLSIAEISNIITIILYFMRVNSVSYTILEDPCWWNSYFNGVIKHCWDFYFRGIRHHFSTFWL